MSGFMFKTAKHNNNICFRYRQLYKYPKSFKCNAIFYRKKTLPLNNLPIARYLNWSVSKISIMY